MKGRKAQIASILCGIACAVCVLVYLVSVRGEADRARADALARYGGEQVEACVATRDIAPGEAVDAGAIERRLWVTGLLPPEAVTAPEDVIGKQASSSILEGEVITTRRFEAEAALVDVPQGMTAVSVPAENVQAVGGAIAPGALIDVYATGNLSTTLIGRSVLVLATSASTSSEIGGGNVTWITLAVEPSAVQELVAAAQSMELYFALPAVSEELSDGKEA